MENKAAREEFKFKDDSEEEEDLLGKESEIAKMRAALAKSKFILFLIHHLDLPPESSQTPISLLNQNKGQQKMGMENGGVTAHPTLADESLQSMEDTGTGGNSAETERQKQIL